MKKTLILILLFMIISSMGMAADEVLCYTERITDAPSFNIYTGRNDVNNPIKWTHSIPEGILKRVVRVGLYIEAYDVDYPSDDEHDRVYFNGYDLGLLEGFNNTWITVEKTVPMEALKTGVIDLKVVVDELQKKWKVKIRASELRFYCSNADSDFSLGVTPETIDVNAGSRVVYNVELVALNGFSSNVALSITGLPTGVSAKFSPNPAIPTISSELIVSTKTNTPEGKYKLIITGIGGGKTHSDEVELIIKKGVNSFIGNITNNFIQKEAKNGDIISLNINFKNKSGSKMKNVEVYSNFSSHLKYLSNDSGRSPKINNGRYLWIFNMGNGETKNINVKFAVKEDGYFGNIENVSYLTHSSIPNRIESNKTKVLIHKEDIVLLKEVDKSQIKPMGELNYTITVKNKSTFPIKNLEIKDVISNYLEFISQDSDLVFSNTGNKLLWKADIDVDKEIIIKIKTKVKTSVFSGVIINNKFKINSPDIKEELNSNIVSSRVSAESVVSGTVKFDKKAEIRQTEVGRIIRFRFTIDNNSNSVLIAPRIKDYLPQGFAYVKDSSTLNGVKIANPIGKNVIIWILPDILPKRSVSLRFQTVIGADTKRGKNINRASLYAKDSANKDITLNASDFINVSTAGFVFYSGIDGIVYIDKDLDGFYSPADKLLEGVEIRLSSGDKMFTNKRGEYSFKNLKPGEYGVGVNKRTLPKKYKLFTESPIIATLFDGLTDQKDFGLVYRGDNVEKPSELEGIVFVDKNGNQKFDNDEPKLIEYKAILDNHIKTYVDDGLFIFTQLKKGRHSIKIDYGHKIIKNEVNLKIGINKVYIPIKYSGIKIIVGGQK